MKSKNISQSIFVGLSLLASTALSASDEIVIEPLGDRVLRSELASISNESYVSAEIEVNGRQDFVSLSLQPEMPACPEGFFCTLVMPEPIEIKLSGVKQLQDECGSTVYYAEQKSSDGIFESVAVIDNRSSQCQYFLPVADTEIRYVKSYMDQLAGEMIENISSFEGEGLIEINEAFDGEVLNADFVDGKLNLELSYGGGCFQQKFDLHWGACKDSLWNDDSVTECEIKLVRTSGFGDQCRAKVIDEVQFNLDGLGQKYLLNIEGTKVLVL